MGDDSVYDIEVGDDGPQRIPRESIRRAVTTALREHGCPRADISIALVDDLAIAILNRQYLGHDRPTDVLSFNLSGPDNDGLLKGEIVLSWETAARQATRRGHSCEAEVMLYAVHGTLHLLGYDDRTAEQGAVMHAQEDCILTQLGYGAVYAGPQPQTGRARRTAPCSRRPRQKSS